MQRAILEDTIKALRLFPKMVIAVGIAFALAGLVAAGAGIYIRNFVGQQLAAQQITTPEDASIPNTPVTNMATDSARRTLFSIMRQRVQMA